MSTATVSEPSHERQGAVTLKGKPLTLVGPEIKVGAKAPDFQVIAPDMSVGSLSQFKGQTVLINVAHSLDTSICDEQTRRFNQEAAKLPNVQILTISMDLPFAQRRWCGAAGIENVKVFSDHRDASFGRAYGTLLKDLRLLARSIFVVDASGTVRYVEYVPEVASHPNYDAALQAARQVAGG
jgi:thiol peroxidase